MFLMLNNRKCRRRRKSPLKAQKQKPGQENTFRNTTWHLWESGMLKEWQISITLKNTISRTMWKGIWRTRDRMIKNYNPDLQLPKWKSIQARSKKERKEWLIKWEEKRTTSILQERQQQHDLARSYWKRPISMNSVEFLQAGQLQLALLLRIDTLRIYIECQWGPRNDRSERARFLKPELESYSLKSELTWGK